MAGALGLGGFSNLTGIGVGSIGRMLGEILTRKGTTLPLLKPVAPPRSGTAIRSSDPFDFFGTLFTNPATSGLNPITNFNKTPLY